MHETEKNILQNFKSLLCEQVNPVQISQMLYKMKVLDTSHKACVLSTRCSRKATWDILFPLLEEHGRLLFILQALLQCGYVDLCLRLGVQCKVVQSVCGDVKVMQRMCFPDSSRNFSQDLFIQLKIKTHNLDLDGNPRRALHYRTQRYKTEYLCEINEEEKMIKADKFAASLCAEIDSHTMLYKREIPTHGLFPELKKLITETTNSHVTQVAYGSRLAIAHVIAGEEDLGEDYLKDSFSASLHIGQCVEFVNMLYIYVFNLLCRYEKNPCRRTLEQILNIAELTLTCLQDEDDDMIRNFWSRMLYLRMIYSLLGISNKGDIICGCTIVPRHMKMARDLLVEVDKIWSGIEARRQMFYFTAQARLAELEGDADHFDVACEYINRAVEIGSNGSFGEISFIKTYAKTLANKKSENVCCKHNKRQAIEHEEEKEQETEAKTHMWYDKDIRSNGYMITHLNPQKMQSKTHFIREKIKFEPFTDVTDNDGLESDVTFQSLLISENLSIPTLDKFNTSVVCINRPRLAE